MVERFVTSRRGGAHRLEPSANFTLIRHKRSGLATTVYPQVGSLIGRLPDARTLRVGYPLMIVDVPLDALFGFELRDAVSGSALATLAVGEGVVIGLVDNSTEAGVWVAAKRVIDAFVPFLEGTILSGRVREVSGDQDWTDYPVTIAGIDTAAKVSTGGMESDGSDIEWRDEDDNILDFELVSGMNTASTTFVVEVPSLHRMGWTKLYMYSGDLILGSGGATITGPHSQPASVQPVFDTLLEEGYTNQFNGNPELFLVGFNQTPPADRLGPGTFAGSGFGQGPGTPSGAALMELDGVQTGVAYAPGGLLHARKDVDLEGATHSEIPPIGSTSSALGSNGTFPGALGFNNP